MVVPIHLTEFEENNIIYIFIEVYFDDFDSKNRL